MTDGPTITCACGCGQRGPSKARGLIITCYSHHRWRRTLDQFPRLTGAAEPWIPTRPHARRMLARYQELAALRPPMSKRAIAWELDISERSVERYAAAARAQTTHDSPRTEAA